MKILLKDIEKFLMKQGYVVVSTIGPDCAIHTSCKDIVYIEADKDRFFLLDLYKARTYRNINKGNTITVTAVDEHKFEGYSIGGRAEISGIPPWNVADKWQERIVSRVTKRIIRTVKHGEKGHISHPEAKLPAPRYLIKVDVKDIIDLTPHPLKI